MTKTHLCTKRRAPGKLNSSARSSQIKPLQQIGVQVCLCFLQVDKALTTTTTTTTTAITTTTTTTTSIEFTRGPSFRTQMCFCHRKWKAFETRRSAQNSAFCNLKLHSSSFGINYDFSVIKNISSSV